MFILVSCYVYHCHYERFCTFQLMILQDANYGRQMTKMKNITDGTVIYFHVADLRTQSFLGVGHVFS